MIIIYLKQACRSLLKNKTYSFLNIIGLSASLTCFAFIAVWVNDELSYDKFNKNYDHIFRLIGLEKTESGLSESAVSSAPMAAALKNDYPEVEQTVRLKMREEIVEYKGGQILQPNILLTDPSFFKIFSYHLTKGNAATALSEPFSIILTESTAKKYFNDSNPVGQTLKLLMYDSSGRGALYKVTGVMPDPPKNAHFTFTMLASFKTVEVTNPDVLTVDGWGDASFYTYILLKKGVDYRSFSNKITQFYKNYIGDRFKLWKSTYFYKLQPLNDIHLRSHLKYEIAATGDINNVYIFSTIGIFILLLAGINYVNLSTARSIGRAKEVSIKKVVGAGRNQLIMQYILEAVVTAFIAFALSLLFCVLLNPLFLAITSKDFSPLSSPILLLFIAGVTIVSGLLSGIYPALIISGFKPVNILKGSFSSGSKGALLRKSLVTTQFTITLVLITGIIIIHSQMAYIQHKDLGFKKEGLIFLKVNGNTDVINGYESFKNALAANPLISGMATSNSLIVSGLGSGVSETVDINGNPLQVSTARLRVDTGYLNVYGIKLLAGRNFSNPSNKDTIRPIILNESAAQKFGWKNPETAIGKVFTMGDQKGIVTGVVKDFHFNSLHEAIQPLAIYPVQDRFSRITISADVSNASHIITLITSAWKKYFPSALLDYDFLDKQIWEQYREEQRFSKIFSCFSLLSLLIACLGLYGLISYAASQKIKEIGIRKVLGASVQGIVMLLTKDFLKLVLLAFIIATPVAWYAMQSWLQDFAYRINIGWWMFFAAGLLVIFIALATVSFHAIKAAIANPVRSLRSE
jgi:putative ABC transport system permease protein